jgi:hypothetical protein
VPKADQRRAKALRFYETLSIVGLGDGREGLFRGLHLATDDGKQYLPAVLHSRLTDLFLAGLHHSQLVYAIEVIILSCSKCLPFRGQRRRISP